MNIKSYNILVVDDDPIIRDMMIDILGLEGYPVEVARNGHEALEKLHSNKNCLVFLDLMMPGMNGREVCKQLNAEPQVRKQHVVIIMSALDNFAEARAMGADGAMPKPFLVEDVLRVVQAYMG